MRTPLTGLVLALTALGCGADLGPTGDVLLRAHTIGGDLDQDGYVIVVDGTQEYQVPSNGEIFARGLSAGSHAFEVRGIAANCDDPGSLEREVREIRTRVVFEITCHGTGVRVSTAVAGLDHDPAFEVYLDGNRRAEVATPNAAVDVSRLAPGTYTVSLGAIAPNCTLAPAARTINVEFRQLAPVEFTGQCVATTGAVLLRVQLRGEDLDISGFSASAIGVRLHEGQGNEVVVSGLEPGERSVQLGGVAPNCRVEGDNPRTVQVAAGRVVRDTVIAVFDVTCARAWGLALIRNGRVVLTDANAEAIETIGSGGNPAWNADGSRGAWRS
jgi:hypothetical protein